MTVLFEKICNEAILPRYAKPWDAGMDVHALERVLIPPAHTVMVRTGIKIAIPAEFFGSARERSGLASRGIRLGGGVIDSGYRGEIKGIMTNIGYKSYIIERGDRIFQIIIQPCAYAHIEEVAALPDDSARGAAGFGSTGR